MKTICGWLCLLYVLLRHRVMFRPDGRDHHLFACSLAQGVTVGSRLSFEFHNLVLLNHPEDFVIILIGGSQAGLTWIGEQRDEGF